MDKKIDTVKMTEKKSHGNHSKFYLFSIRNKILICFLVPILFMIFIGYSAYQKSADGMSKNYKTSTLQSIQMITDHIDMSDIFIEAEGMKYAFNSDLSRYYLGLYESDPTSKLNLVNSIKSNILTSQTTNTFISHIHIIPKNTVNLFSTAVSSNVKGFFEDYYPTMKMNGNTYQKWVDSHDILDAQLNLNKNDYIMSFQLLSQSKNAVVIIDIKTSAIQGLLTKLDLGNGSIIGFITENGRELIYENLSEGQVSNLTTNENVFFGQDFFTSIESDSTNGVKEVSYNGENYFFFYSKSSRDYSTICALVPTSIVIGQAEDIKTLTFGIVILACIIAAIIGISISSGIQKNMKRIVKGLSEVANGDLTVDVTVKGHDEFRGLAASATDMILNNKNLVTKVEHATKELETSSVAVKDASHVINEYSTNITQAIDEINQGMSQQSIHAQECVERTDILSNEIQEVSRVVEQVESLVNETEEMIRHGMNIIQNLSEKAQSTTDITIEVGKSIEILQKESEIINTFVNTITGISSQTNLLSLNASIEAARAGEAGLGFSVVAEEIRKLADDSAKAAKEISNNVTNITSQTKKSVESAKQAEIMVEQQTQAVQEVILVFRNMNTSMTELINGLKDIIKSTERADKERNDTLEAVKNISEIIEETAQSAEVVHSVALKLLKNVENLNQTANALGENMTDLKTEISVFKTK